MKILNLKFKNINSLAGEWEIDFTKSEFTDNGIFAITGKTGAGKSSILDAISLALYGRTPRVDITGQSNDVMTRNTGDCYSEIMFEVEGKIWTSSWKQERARKKAGGKLQQVERVIADENKNIVADKISIKGAKKNEDEMTVNEKIEKIIGLNFEQFTKVILLAQGSFAAFLQADKNDKGELLEQITGTEIYGEISRKVYERNKNEKEKLDKILVEIGAIKMLSEEEIENLNNEIIQFNTEKKRIDNDLQTIQTAKKWLADLENLQKQVVEAKEKLPDLEQKVEITKKALEQSETVLKTAKTEKENSDKIWVKVRELDTKIIEKNKLINPVLQTIVELEKNKNNLTQAYENHKKSLIDTRNNLQQKQDWTAANSKYESLVGQFAVIENKYLQVNNLLKYFNDKKNEVENTKKELETKITLSKKSQTTFAEKEKALNDNERELKVKKADLATILAGKELNAYQEEKENLTKLGTQIKDLIEIEKDLSKNQKEIEKYKEFIIFSENSEKELSKTITENKTVVENLKIQIELLDENIKLIKTIQSLDEHRKSLEDGKSCPLCGSTEHPFARGNEPKIGEKETELKNRKEQEQRIRNAVQQNEKTLTKLISDKDNAQKNKKNAEKYWMENGKKRDAILDEIKTLKPDFLFFDNENEGNMLDEIHKQTQNEYKQIASVISKATESEKLLKKLQDEEIPKLQQAKQTAEKAKTEAETNQKLVEQRVENQKKLLKESDEKYREENAELLKIFSNYDVTTIETLKKYLNDWNNNKKAIEELKEQMNKLEHALALTNSEIETNQKLMSAKTAEKQSFEMEKQTLSTERYTLFGDKRVEDEEKRLNNCIEKAEIAKADAEKSETNANTELAKNQAIIAEKEKELIEKQAEKSTEKTPEELQGEYDEKKPQSDLFSQKTGANRQALKSNEENLQKNRKKLDEKELQQQVCIKWGNLNELIGSQDGKKYRNFAQALTFEHLIGLSNRQLQKMSERYILKRNGNAGNPFDLLVIDKFQNCEERTAQNLSGGEKFIVSLSLALGLANMASKNMKIDTMFIDEGFGTLDSDYLDVALSALSNLQNEGKLIGVISHLTELKERIATHIEVIPTGDGHSQIEMQR